MFQFIARLFATVPKAAGSPNLKVRLTVDGMEDRYAPAGLVNSMVIHGAFYPDHNNRDLPSAGDMHGIIASNPAVTQGINHF